MPVVPLKPNSWSLDKAIEQFLADKFEDGQLISHAWLEWALNLPKPSTAKEMVNCQFVILDRVEQFKEALLTQHQIYIVSVRGKGYRSSRQAIKHSSLSTTPCKEFVGSSASARRS